MCRVYNHTTKQWTSHFEDLKYGLVYIHDNIYELGYFEKSMYNFPVSIEERIIHGMDYRLFKDIIKWNNHNGYYTFEGDWNNSKDFSKYMRNYPVEIVYNLSKLDLDEFSIPEIDEDSIYKELNFTIGLEFETSTGNIPWADLHENALIPLYDGSITGHEYVTLPLTSKQYPLIKKYVELLKYYTSYNKDCSIHIHFGGFPINMEYIDRLVKCWDYFQNMLLEYIPKYSYQVERYKSNGKAYNKPLSIRDLRRFIYHATGNIINSDYDLYLPNEYDRTEDRKWNVTGRYYNMNIMHLVSGKEHKTVEFRFIRPTYHYDEIKTYILVLGGFLKWVMMDNGKIKSIPQMVQEIYSPEISKVILHNLNVFKHLTKMQINHLDFAGLSDYKKDLFLKHNPLC